MDGVLTIQANTEAWIKWKPPPAASLVREVAYRASGPFIFACCQLGRDD